MKKLFLSIVFSLASCGAFAGGSINKGDVFKEVCSINGSACERLAALDLEKTGRGAAII